MNAATAYVICGYLWILTCIGTCTYLVFWMGHSGWWYLLALILCSGFSHKRAAKIAGTWKKEYEDDDD